MAPVCGVQVKMCFVGGWIGCSGHVSSLIRYIPNYIYIYMMSIISPDISQNISRVCMVFNL